MTKSRILSLFLAVLASATATAQTATHVDDSATTPAPPLGSLNVIPQNNGGSPTVITSHYVLYPTIQVACPAYGDLGGPVNTALDSVTSNAGAVIDARRCTGATNWTTATTITADDIKLLLPCATILTVQTFYVAAGVRNTDIEGCTTQGGSAATGLEGGTVWEYQGTFNAFAVGDVVSGTDTPGFTMRNMVINIQSAGASSQAISLDRTQEIHLEDLLLAGANLGNTEGIVLNGQGNYSGGSFDSIKLENFDYGIVLTGDGTGAGNASTFSRMHIVCPETAGAPITGTYGVALDYGDGNTFVGGDIESCDTMLYLGAGATDNTFVGVRNENNNTQVNAASGSSYNQWMTGGTMFTGKLTDGGTHNSFQDAFHFGINTLNGSLWRSQADATISDHIYTGIGLGNVRGHITEFITDVPGESNTYQNAWQWGPGDGTTGVQTFSLNDLLNDVQRIGVDQYTTAGGNNQTRINSAGTGAVDINAAANSGTGGLVIGSGGSSPDQVASIDSSGNTDIAGYLRFLYSGSVAWELNCPSISACNIDDWSTSSPIHRIRLYSGAGIDLDAQGANDVTINATSTSGSGGFTVFGGGATYYNTKLFQVQNNNNGTGNLFIPWMKAASGHNCLQIDDSGYMTNTGLPCGTGSGSGTVTSVNTTAPSDFILTGCSYTTSGTCAFTWAATASGTAPIWNQNTTGTASNITDESNDTLTSLPYLLLNYSQLTGTPPTWNQDTTGNAATATKLAANTLGCIDGWDHLPCVVFQQTNQSITATQTSYAQVWPTSGNAAAGIYQTTGYVFATTAGACTGSVSGTAEMFVKATQNGGTANGWAVASAQIAATSSSGSITATPVFNVAAATTAFNVEVTLTCTGSVAFTSSPTVSYALTIVRLQ